MIGFATKVLSYTHGMDQAAFEAADLVYDATLRNLELIGESGDPYSRGRACARRRGHPMAASHRDAQQTRSRLPRHIDNDTLWSIVQTDIPALLEQLRKLKNPRS